VFTVQPRHRHNGLRPYAYRLSADVSYIRSSALQAFITLDHSSDACGTPRPEAAHLTARVEHPGSTERAPRLHDAHLRSNARHSENSRRSLASYPAAVARSKRHRRIEKMEGGSNPEVPSGRRHSVLLSGLFDIKLFQGFEYPVCKQFMRKTIRMWIGRRHPQLR